jgi:protein-S-isoprenylcysteine O-methyltransferase Ste14
MTLRNILRHIIGYLVGFSIFVVGIPLGLYRVSKKLDGYLPINLIAAPRLRTALSLLIAGVGIVFALWSNLWLFFVGKGGPVDGLGIQISPRSQHLITNGPYRYTRNPMMFGALSFYFGIAVFLNSAICIGLVAVLFVVAPVYLKHVEEKRLLRDFGESYEQYRRQVSMLVPLPPSTKPTLEK